MKNQIGKLRFSATSTKNWFFGDTILDYFKKTRQHLIKSQCIGNIKPLPETFKSTIIQNGNLFETESMKFLKQSLGARNFKTICVDYRTSTSRAMYDETIQAMKKGVPIIYQGVVHNYDNGTYGIPDLLVRSDWINKLVDNGPLQFKEIHLGAPELGTPWHYRVVDIKCSTMNMASNGVNMRNTNSVPAFKGQIYIYNEALAKMQGYNPGRGYILGKRWKQTNSVKGKKITTTNNNCFDKYGEIHYDGYDAKFVEETEKALSWLVNLDENHQNWDVLPPSNEYLYPNMKNTYDYPFHSEKKEVAENIGEITNVWYCGTKNRAKAFEAGITSWRDPKCTSEILGHRGNIAQTVDIILDVNRRTNQLIHIGESFYDSDYQEADPDYFEFFVDYETINSVVDQPTVPVTNDYNRIYMIGIGYSHQGEWIYQDFTLSACTPDEEYRIITEWLETMQELAGDKKIRLYHWSHIEHTLFRTKFEEYPDLGEMPIYDWVDLCKIFTTTPIVPKGALSFGLKEIARAMYNNRLIESYWNVQNPCNNGLESMVIFKHIRDQAQREGKDIRQVPLLKDIIDYNELDCKVMWEMLEFLRREYQIWSRK